MSSDWTPKSALHDGLALCELVAGDAESNELLVSSRRHFDGWVLSLDVISICLIWNRSSREALVCGVDYLFTGDARSAGVFQTVMEEELRKKNRRLLIAIIVFAIGFTVLIILWKLSIYQKT